MNVDKIFLDNLLIEEIEYLNIKTDTRNLFIDNQSIKRDQTHKD